jgi:hypothetical protein
MILADMGLAAAGLFLIYAGFHLGAGHAHYRHQRRGCMTGHRRPRVWASLGRGPFVWVSVPLPGRFRLGRRL